MFPDDLHKHAAACRCLRCGADAQPDRHAVLYVTAERQSSRPAARVVASYCDACASLIPALNPATA